MLEDHREMRPTGALGRLDPVQLGEAEAGWLLADDVDARLERGDRGAGMRAGRRTHVHEVEPLGGQQLRQPG